MQVLGTSAYVPELLMRAPEVIQFYADGPSGPKLLEVEPDGVARALVASAGRHPDPKRAIAAARTLRRRELARIASADLLGMLEVTDVCNALTSVWVAVLEAALEAVIRANTRDAGAAGTHRGDRDGPPRGRRARLRLGRRRDVRVRTERGFRRIGGGAMVGDHRRTGAHAAGLHRARTRRWRSTRTCDRRAATARLVRTLASYETYYARFAQTWEVQALLRAHRVAGDQDLGERFLLMIDKTRYPTGGVSAEAVQEIRRIKARVDAERLPRGADPNTHTKLGRGGLADIEWTVQLLQLRHAHKVPALHCTSTLQALNAIGAAELIAEGDVELLRQAWLTATRARNALVLVRGKPTDQLPGPGRQLNAVALAAGWDTDDGGEFLDNYLRVTRRAKVVVRKVFGG